MTIVILVVAALVLGADADLPAGVGWAIGLAAAAGLLAVLRLVALAVRTGSALRSERVSERAGPR